MQSKILNVKKLIKKFHVFVLEMQQKKKLRGCGFQNVIAAEVEMWKI